MSDRAWSALFHKLWTNSVGKPGYVKEDWRQLEHMLLTDPAASTHVAAPGDPLEPIDIGTLAKTCINKLVTERDSLREEAQRLRGDLRNMMRDRDEYYDRCMGIADSTRASPDYKCSGCGAHGVKLWRQYQVVADAIKLKCAVCAVVDQILKCSRYAPRSAEEIDHEGRWKGKHGPTDKIGGLVPAVPCDDGASFWGYTSVPDEGVNWWRKLPTRKTS